MYHWKVMPFGLHSAPATFQRALDSVIGPDMETNAFAYLDDIIIIIIMCSIFKRYSDGYEKRTFASMQRNAVSLSTAWHTWGTSSARKESTLIPTRFRQYGN